MVIHLHKMTTIVQMPAKVKNGCKGCRDHFTITHFYPAIFIMAHLFEHIICYTIKSYNFIF